MKIIHISQTDSQGGAAIACVRHAEAMKASGLDANVIVAKKIGWNSIVSKPHWGWHFIVNQIESALNDWIVQRKNPTGYFSIMSFGLPFHKTKEVIEADVIFLHWINKSALSIKGVERILKLGKPTYWYMHDMFPITGGCHYSLACNGYQNKCTSCTLIGNDGSKDITQKQLNKKIKHWSRCKNLHFITPSNWLKDCVVHSSLAKGHTCIVIPNVINTEIFKPYDTDSKSFFGLNSSKKAILFSSHLLNSIYKGASYTMNCLKYLDPNKYEGLIIGNMSEGLDKEIPMKVIATGYLSDNLSLALAYNACDTVIITSIAENYPNVVLEAMACGRPCIGFNTGGIPELIRHKETGYLTEENTTEGILKGLSWLFEDKQRYIDLSQAARQQIVSNNSYKGASIIYSELYLNQ